MRARDALKLNPGDEVIDKETGESIRVICAFEDRDGHNKPIVMIEGTGTKQGYNHWRSDRVK